VNHKHFDLEDWQKTLGPLLEGVAGGDAKAQIQKMALQVSPLCSTLWIDRECL
jgi:hypothetical protein